MESDVMEYILVGVGGVFGSITRYLLGKYISEKKDMIFPIGTFVINITGALLLGIVATFQSNRNLYLLLGDGFLGAYTTFSTFMYEGFNLLQDREGVNALLYITLSVIVGVLGFILGSRIGIIIKG
jgi:fluoride exporter